MPRGASVHGLSDARREPLDHRRPNVAFLLALLALALAADGVLLAVVATAAEPGALP